jgi:hypothetical protein
MEKYQLPADISVLYVTATSFPDGVMAAWEKLHSLTPRPKTRKYFGISRPDHGTIVYKAAVATEEDLKAQPDQEPFVIPKGTYISTFIPDFMKDPGQIGRCFEELLKVPGLDPQGFCLEIYEGEKDVRCMIRLVNFS